MSDRCGKTETTHDKKPCVLPADHQGPRLSVKCSSDLARAVEDIVFRVLWAQDYEATREPNSIVRSGNAELRAFAATGLIMKLLEAEKPSFDPAKWWRVVGADGELWRETTSLKEALSSMRTGDKLYRMYSTEAQSEWREEK